MSDPETQRWHRLKLDQVDSTNAHLARCVADGETRAIWCVADSQSRGIGRRGRDWISGDGNFFGSLLIWPDKPVAELAQYSFVAALAVLDALAQTSESMDLSLKWPNDVLLRGQKIAGILLETRAAGDRNALIIGIGVNLRQSPDLTGEGGTPATDLHTASGVSVTPPEFLDALDQTIRSRMDAFDAHGFTAIRDAWMAEAYGIGRKMTARLISDEKAGVFEGIDETGALLLTSEEGTMVVPAGDVYFEPETT